MTIDWGELRSAREGEGSALLEAVLAYRAHPQWGDVLEWAPRGTVTVEAIATAMRWHAPHLTRGGGWETDALWWSDKPTWALAISDVLLADNGSFDLVRRSHEWSVVPAWECLHQWEDWAAENVDEELRLAPRRAIEAKEAWLRGEIGGQELDTARSAAESAMTAAESAMTAAESAMTARPAVRAARAARSAAWPDGSAARWSAGWSVEYDRLKRLFACYVVEAIAREGGWWRDSMKAEVAS